MPELRVMFNSVSVREWRSPLGFLFEFDVSARVEASATGGRWIEQGNFQGSFQARGGLLIWRGWHSTFDVTNQTEVRITFQVVRTTGINRNLGIFTTTLRWPYRQGIHNDSPGTREFSLNWSVTRLGGTRRSSDELWACRGTSGGAQCATYVSGPIMARMEIHPVRPCPVGDYSPNRRGLPRTEEVTSEGSVPVAQLTANSAPNIMPNPPVIPILDARDTAQLQRSAARIEYTYYRPATLRFQDNDDRLRWSVERISGTPQVAFVGNPRGLRVLAHGTGNQEGEVRFRVEIQSSSGPAVPLTMYRALVRRIRVIRYRLNLLIARGAGSRDVRPARQPADAERHIQIANRFLRQLGVELQPDPSPAPGEIPRELSRSCRITPVQGRAGIFEVTVPPHLTRNIADNPQDPTAATLLNYRSSTPPILNIAYVHSMADGSEGWTTDGGASVPTGAVTETESHDPSTSWIPPSGVSPDGRPARQRMQVTGPQHRAGRPNLYALLITNANETVPPSSSPDLQYGGTLAHEVGHVLGLMHRGRRPPPDDRQEGPEGDGLRFPPFENVMHYANWHGDAQDFDIIQAKAVRYSELFGP